MRNSAVFRDSAIRFTLQPKRTTQHGVHGHQRIQLGHSPRPLQHPAQEFHHEPPLRRPLPLVLPFCVDVPLELLELQLNTGHICFL